MIHPLRFPSRSHASYTRPPPKSYISPRATHTYAQAVIIRAEGEAEAASKISKAVADYGSALIEIRRIDAARDIAEILSRSRNITYLPGGQNSGLLLGLTASQQ